MAPPVDALNAAVGRHRRWQRWASSITELGADFLRGTMPVDARTKQPYGLLHGGASVLLAETLASMRRQPVRGPDAGKRWSASRSTPTTCAPSREGVVTGTARPLHVGRSTQVWEIRIEDDTGPPGLHLAHDRGRRRALIAPIPAGVGR